MLKKWDVNLAKGDSGLVRKHHVLMSALVGSVMFGLIGCSALKSPEPVTPYPQEFSSQNPCKAIERLPLTRIPIYPKRARRIGQEGWVALLFDVTPEGKVENIRVADSSPKDVFEQAVITELTSTNYPPFQIPLHDCRLSIRFILTR